jgi:hypothetical protein
MPITPKTGSLFHADSHPVIVTEQRADPVELVFQAFLRLDPEQRVRLVQRLK